jgi:integrase
MNIGDINKNPLVLEWMDTLNPRPNTERNYKVAMQLYTEYTKMTPEELLKEAETEIRDGKLMRERRVKKHIIGFRKMLLEKEYAPTTIKAHMAGVRSFYRVFDIELPTLPRAGSKAKPLEKNRVIPTKEDIQEVLKIADPLERAIVLIGVSSGLSAEEITNLKVGDFKNGYEPETEITTLTLRRTKVGFDFVTFLSPEASRAVWDYLNYRNRTSTVKNDGLQAHLEKQKIYSDKDYLLCGRWISGKYTPKGDDGIRQIASWSLFKIYRDLAEKAQKSTPMGDWGLIRSHNIRKYYNSAMLNAGADSFFVEFTMGHTLDDTRSAYFRASPEKLRDIYKKFIPYLTIQKPLDVSESAEYKEIKHENDILRAETASHVVERSELSAMKTELESLKAENKTNSEFMDLVKSDPEQMTKFMDLIKEAMKDMKD